MVTLKTVNIIQGSMDHFKKQGSVYVLAAPMTVQLYIRVDGKSDNVFLMRFGEGYACDGLSVPKPFRWFLPSWDKKNGAYNLAGVVHDALYGNSGFCTFTREECDDIFRGLLRESSVGRFKAGVADKAVEWAAKSHFGSDDLKVAHLVSLEVV